MKVAALAVSLFLAGNVLAQDNAPSDELYDFKGFRLGSSVEFLESYYATICGNYPLGSGTKLCHQETTVATHRAVVDYYFNSWWAGDDSQNGLYRINIRVENDPLISEVRTALIDRYGPPHRKLQVNPLYPEETYTPPADSWVKGDSEIIYSRSTFTSSTFTSSTVGERRITRLVYVHWPLYLEHERRQAERRADDL